MVDDFSAAARADDAFDLFKFPWANANKFITNALIPADFLAFTIDGQNFTVLNWLAAKKFELVEVTNFIP